MHPFFFLFSKDYFRPSLVCESDNSYSSNNSFTVPDTFYVTTILQAAELVESSLACLTESKLKSGCQNLATNFEQANKCAFFPYFIDVIIFMVGLL